MPGTECWRRMLEAMGWGTIEESLREEMWSWLGSGCGRARVEAGGVEDGIRAST